MDPLSNHIVYNVLIFSSFDMDIVNINKRC